MKMYALVQNGEVVNMIVWDGESEWTPPEGLTAIPTPDGSPVAIGWSFDGTSFEPPAG